MSRIYTLEGSIGVGKSTVLEIIKRNFSNVKIFSEGLDKDIYKQVVKDYYEYPKENAYTFQLTMLIRKWNEGKDAQDYSEQTGGISLIERTVSSNAKVFCNIAKECGYINDWQYRVYQQTYERLKKPLKRPDKVLYLNCPVELAFERIEKRGRGGESNISFQYLKRLDELYTEWINNYKGEVINLYFERDLSEEEIIEEVRKMI